MYDRTITVFNRSGSEKNGFVWFPTIIDGVNLVVDKGAVMAKTGLSDADKANLHIRYISVEGRPLVEGKSYLLPKEWNAQTYEGKMLSITFNEGHDFFIEGEYPEEVIVEDESIYANGLLSYMKSKYDNVFKINTVGKYNLIPHFEIGGE